MDGKACLAHARVRLRALDFADGAHEAASAVGAEHEHFFPAQIVLVEEVEYRVGHVVPPGGKSDEHGVVLRRVHARLCRLVPCVLVVPRLLKHGLMVVGKAVLSLNQHDVPADLLLNHLRDCLGAAHRLPVADDKARPAHRVGLQSPLVSLEREVDDEIFECLLRGSRGRKRERRKKCR